MQNSITQGPILRPLLRFFFPILLGTFFQQLYNTADAVILGNFVGIAALAAVGGPTTLIINFLVNLFVGLSSGATVVTAQYYGAHREKELQETVCTGLALALTAGVVITALGIALSGPVLRLMGTPQEVLAYSLAYLRVYFCGTVASFLYNIASSILRAVGDTRRPLYFLAAACLTNILLDLVFVAWMDMGVTGAALATVLSQAVSAALSLLALFHPGRPYWIAPRDIRFYGDKLRSILCIGLPAGIQANLYTISNLVLQACINSFGTTAIAAWSAFGKVDGFYWMISGAFGVSVTTFASQNFGAQKYDRLKKGTWIAVAAHFVTTAVISALFCICAPVLLGFFTSDRDVLSLGIHILWMTAPFYFTFICIEIFSATARGAGDSVRPVLFTFSGVCLLRVLWVLTVLPRWNCLDAVIVSYPISWSITSLLYLVYYFRGGWLRRGIAHAGFSPEIMQPPEPKARLTS